jgi:hypothetical protein
MAYEFTSVAAVSSKDVWAVGSGSASGSSFKTIAEHWNGKKWSVVATPNPGPSGATLTSISAVSSNNIWAVGGTGDPSLAAYRGDLLVEHWNGVKWLEAHTSPSITYGAFDAVAAISPNDVWVAGSAGASKTGRLLSEQYNGSVWHVKPNPGGSPGEPNELVTVGVISSSNIWAAGVTESTSALQLDLQHWNGAVWSAEAVPSPLRHAVIWGLGSDRANGLWGVGWKGTAAAIFRYTCPQG